MKTTQDAAFESNAYSQIPQVTAQEIRQSLWILSDTADCLFVNFLGRIAVLRT